MLVNINFEQHGPRLPVYELQLEVRKGSLCIVSDSEEGETVMGDSDPDIARSLVLQALHILKLETLTLSQQRHKHRQAPPR